jgi:DNA-binding beta-propeller fold protein YncE
LDSPNSVAVSPDGRNVYVTTRISDAVVVFDRNASTGALTLKTMGNFGCVSETGTDGTCIDGVALLTPLDVAVSADGRNVYVATGESSAVAVFDRSPQNGVLSQKGGQAGCISDDGTGGACANGVELYVPTSVTASADGRNVYVASTGGVAGALAIFDRDAATGALTQKPGLGACISDNGSFGACVDGVGLVHANAVAMSPDDRAVVVAATGSDSVAIFDRDVETGALTQKAGVGGCVSESGSGGDCVDGVALSDAVAVAVSRDGRSVYVAGRAADAVAAFAAGGLAYDIDGDGEQDALTDGLLLLRHQFGFTGATLITGAVDLVECTRCTAPPIEAYLQALSVP